MLLGSCKEVSLHDRELVITMPSVMCRRITSAVLQLRAATAKADTTVKNKMIQIHRLFFIWYRPFYLGILLQ